MTKPGTEGPVTEPEGRSVADELIGDDPEPPGGWRRFNDRGERVDAEGNLLAPSPKGAPAP